MVPDDELDATVQSLVDRILALSPHVLALGKRAFYQLEGLDEATAYTQATGIMVQNVLHSDAQEGISAFLQKRSPHWGRITCKPICYLPFAICHLPFAICHLPFAICYLHPHASSNLRRTPPPSRLSLRPGIRRSRRRR